MQRKIADYRMLKFYGSSNMRGEIIMMIRQGYELWGGPFSSGEHFFQAVVKYEEDKAVGVGEEL